MSRLKPDMKRIGWKVFTVAAIALESVEIARPIGSSPGPTIASLDVAVLLGLVGYSWSLGIGPRWIWKALFCVELPLLVVVGSGALLMGWQARSSMPPYFIATLMLYAAMLLGKLYGLYRYGFGDSAPWHAVQPAAAAARGA